MTRVSPVPESAATERVAQTYGRLKELFEGQEIPAPFLVCGRVPAFVQDLYMNFKKFVWTDGALDAQTKATVALAVSSVLRSAAWIDLFAARCKWFGANDQHVADTLAVAATCAMYNAFFKFRDLSGTETFSGMGVGLRAHTFSQTSLSERVVELINVAVSDIHGCKPCTTGHVAKARELGVADDALLETIQCAATVAAAATFWNAAQAS